MVTIIQIIVHEINQNVTHKAGFFLYKVKQVRTQKNASEHATENWCEVTLRDY